MHTAHSQQLHQWLSQHAQSTCYLLLDPQLRPLEPDSTLAQTLQAMQPAAPAPTPLQLPFIPEGARPWITPMDTERLNGSLALSASLQEALTELDSDSLKRGMGRRIGGWLVSDASANTIASHLTRMMVQTAPDTQRMLLRLQDPAVLWPIFSVLTPLQRTTLLGPIKGWWLLNPAGHLVMLENPHIASSALPPPHAPALLNLDAAQWAHVMHLRTFNATINRWLWDMPQDQRATLTHQQLDQACARNLAALQSPTPTKTQKEVSVRNSSHVIT